MRVPGHVAWRVDSWRPPPHLGRPPRAVTYHPAFRSACPPARSRHSNGPEGRRPWIKAGCGPTADWPILWVCLWPVYDWLQTMYKKARACPSAHGTPALACAMFTVLTAACVSHSCRPPTAAAGQHVYLYNHRRRRSTFVLDADCAAVLAGAATDGSTRQQQPP